MLGSGGSSLRNTNARIPVIWKSSPCVALRPNGELRVLSSTWAINDCSDARLLLMSVSNCWNSSVWKILRCVKPISIAVTWREERKQQPTQEWQLWAYNHRNSSQQKCMNLYELSASDGEGMVRTEVLPAATNELGQSFCYVLSEPPYGGQPETVAVKQRGAGGCPPSVW